MGAPELRGDAVIVTGVSRGLGAALAGELLGRGFTVLGIGRGDNPALAGDRYRFVRFDLSDPAGIDVALEPAFAELKRQRPGSVCLLNNAATAGPLGTLGRLTGNEIVSSLAVNLAAAVALANLFCRVFTDPDTTRRIINVSSGAAQHAIPGNAGYCIAKAGIEMLTRVLAAEQQGPRFQAISVRPGVIDTEMQAFARSQPAELFPSVELFEGFHRDGQLVAPAVVASAIADRLVLDEVEHGSVYGYQEGDWLHRRP